jgi:zinc transport system substrate-binding protein
MGKKEVFFCNKRTQMRILSLCFVCLPFSIFMLNCQQGLFMFRLLLRIFASLAVFVLWVACSQQADTVEKQKVAGQNSPLSFAVSLAPLQGLLQELGIKSELLVPPGKDPHHFAPTPQQIQRLHQSKILFHSALPFERQLAQRLQKDEQDDLLLCDLTKGLHWRTFGAGEKKPSHKHSHEHQEGHGGHEGHDHHAKEGKSKEQHTQQKDLHVWMGLENMALMADNALRCLEQKDSAHTAQYRIARDTLTQKLALLREDLKKQLTPFKGQEVFVFHPAFGYLLQEFGLRQRAVEIDGKSPSPAVIQHLIKDAKEAGVKVIFVQPQFDPSGAQLIAEAIGGQVVFINPLAVDVLANFRAISHTLAQNLNGINSTIEK